MYAVFKKGTDKVLSVVVEAKDGMKQGHTVVSKATAELQLAARQEASDDHEQYIKNRATNALVAILRKTKCFMRKANTHPPGLVPGPCPEHPVMGAAGKGISEWRR